MASPGAQSGPPIPMPQGPSDLGWQEIRVGIALVVITTLAMVLRFVARFVRHAKLELDDWLAVTSMVFIIAMLIELILWATIGGSGYHFGILMGSHDINTVMNFFKVFLANEFTYAITSPLVKLTLLAFYRRLFAVQRFKLVADVLACMCILWGVSTLIVVGFQCQPLEHYWNPEVPGTCINLIAFVEGIQGINVFLDLSILVLPLPMVWGLHRPWQDKLALTGVFMLGGFVVGASIYRLVAITQINVEDMSYTTVDGVIWTFVEPCIGLVCACLPVIRGLFPAFVKRTTSRATPQYGYGHVSGGRHTLLGGLTSTSKYEESTEMESSRNGSPHHFDKYDVPGPHAIQVRTTVNVV